MALPLRFGILAPQVVPYEIQKQRWHELEEYRFDSLWFADHFVNPAMPSGRWFEAYTLMAAAAAQTERIRLGALVTSITFRHPALFAKEVLTIDHISNGRIEVALGSAGSPYDVAMEGLDDWSRGERTKRFIEFTEMLDTLLTNDPANYDGTFYSAHEAVMNPGPVQKPRPPLTLAAHGPITMRFAAKHADSWNQVAGGLGLVGDPLPETAAECVERVRSRNEQMDGYCAEIGRDPGTLRRSILAGGGVTPDHVWSSEESFRDFVGRYIEAGVDEFILYYPSRMEQGYGFYERIARETIPALKAAHAG